MQAEYPDVQIVNDSGGDAGIDAYVPSMRTLFAMYCPEVVPVRKKYYQDKIRPDLAKAARLRASGTYQIDHWIFLTPAPLTTDLHQYIAEKATEAGFISGVSKAEPYLLDLLLKHKRLHSQFPELVLPDIEKKLESGFTDVRTQLDAQGDAVSAKLDSISDLIGSREEDAQKWAHGRHRAETRSAHGAADVRRHQGRADEVLLPPAWH